MEYNQASVRFFLALKGRYKVTASQIYNVNRSVVYYFTRTNEDGAAERPSQISLGSLHEPVMDNMHEAFIEILA